MALHACMHARMGAYPHMHGCMRMVALCPPQPRPALAASRDPRHRFNARGGKAHITSPAQSPTEHEHVLRKHAASSLRHHHHHHHECSEEEATHNSPTRGTQAQACMTPPAAKRATHSLPRALGGDDFRREAEDDKQRQHRGEQHSGGDVYDAPDARLAHAHTQRKHLQHPGARAQGRKGGMRFLLLPLTSQQCCCHLPLKTPTNILHARRSNQFIGTSCIHHGTLRTYVH